MIIECPSCRFRRDVPTASIRPGKKYKVTCPRCSTVFHFSMPEEETNTADDKENNAAAAPQSAAETMMRTTESVGTRNRKRERTRTQVMKK